MKRRDFLKTLFTVVIGGGLAPDLLAKNMVPAPNENSLEYFDNYIKDYLTKMRCFNKAHWDDVYLDRNQYQVLASCVRRFFRLQRTVGHGNFHLLSFDDALNISSNYPRIGPFTRKELDFVEKIFYQDATLYGFIDEKPLKNLTDRIKRREVVKVSNTGNYLYKGLPMEVYQKIKREIGDQLILTSGVRSVIKQFLLFLNKTKESKGNLSLASRSLAPPGYSFHSVGDFDVGQVGFGVANFTDRFATTEVYRKLQDLGYLKLRYSKDNLLGVRYEPWHIRVHSLS